jgi:Transcriptional regulatory protein, C terminal/PAS fold
MTGRQTPAGRDRGTGAGSSELVRLREVLDALPDGVIWYRTLPHRGVEFINRALAARTGFSRDEYFADPQLLLGIVHPNDLKIVMELLERGPGPEPQLVRLMPRKGGVDWVELRGVPIIDGLDELTAVVVQVRWISSPDASKRSPTKVFGELRIEFDRARVVLDDRTVHLTPSELRVLTLLTERLGQIVTRKEIMRDLWESAHVGAASAAEAHISTLRRKIERDPRQPRHIETVRGRGYRFIA